MLYNIYFSAKGTTKKCAEFIAKGIAAEESSVNLLAAKDAEALELQRDDVLLLAMPVYGGYIPKICVENIRKLKGNDTPVVLVAIYGNRHFDNALLQMQDLVEANGFKVIAAGAFVAEHSIFPSVAHGRPHDKDYEDMACFAQKCKEILRDNESWAMLKLDLPGAKDYDSSSFKGIPFHPDADTTCTSCQKCVQLCPVQAIAAANPKVTDGEKCINCGACIAVCSVKARDYHGIMYKTAKAGFELKCMKPMGAFTYYLH